VESLMQRLEPVHGHERPASSLAPVIDMRTRQGDVSDNSTGRAYVVHRFDTDDRDLEGHGYTVELHERREKLLVVLTRTAGDDRGCPAASAHVQIDRSWALEILSRGMSPLSPFERRLNQPWPDVLENARAIVGHRTLQRVDSRLTEFPPAKQPDSPADSVTSS